MKEKILQLKHEGKSIRQIAKLVGLSKSAVWGTCNPEKQNQYQRNRRKNFKLELIELQGGKCKICGYKRCSSALDFHHKDKTLKLFSISNGYRTSKTRNQILEEVKKCILLRSNCHHEVHDGVSGIP